MKQILITVALALTLASRVCAGTIGEYSIVDQYDGTLPGCRDHDGSDPDDDDEDAGTATETPEPPITATDKAHAVEALCEALIADVARTLNGEAADEPKEAGIARLLIAANELMVARFGVDQWRGLSIITATMTDLLKQSPNGDLVAYCLTRKESRHGPAARAPHALARATPSTREPERQWYVGGTLYKAQVVDWWKASRENKLATCADIVVGLWKSGKLNDELVATLHSIDDTRPLAVELVAFIDTGTDRNKLSRAARKSIEHSGISEVAAAGVVMMGWLKN